MNKPWARSLLLSVVLAGGAGCLTVVESELQKLRDVNRGVLVLTPGMTIEEVKDRSTLDIGEGAPGLGKDSQGKPRHRTFMRLVRFDWEIAGTKLYFKDCHSYWLGTGYDGTTRIVELQIVTAQRHLSWGELKAEMYEMQKRLHADGWKPVRYRDGGDADETLRDMLEKPTLSHLEESVGCATYGKGEAALSLCAKRGTFPEEGEDPYAKNNFLHYVLMKTRARWDELNDISQDVLPR